MLQLTPATPTPDAPLEERLARLEKLLEGLTTSTPPPSPVVKPADSDPWLVWEQNRKEVTAICVPMSWEHVPKRFVASLTGLRKGEHLLSYVNGDSIETMRNAGVQEARRHGCKQILFIDGDMTFPEHALEQLQAHDVPIVGGLCRQRRAPFAACMWNRTGTSWGKPDVQECGLQAVDATGGAFLLVQMEVFRTVPEPWFRATRWDLRLPTHERLSEDIYFCDQARKAGLPVYVDVDLSIGHLVMAEIIDGEGHEPQVRLENASDNQEHSDA